LRAAFWNTQLAWNFALEVLICLIHEPPFLDHDVDMSVTDSLGEQKHRMASRTMRMARRS